MNRRKKMINKLKKKAKKSNEKNIVSNKPKYISKAEREKLASNPVDMPELTDELNDEQEVK